MGVNSLPETVTRQRRDCDLNPGLFCAWVHHANQSATEPPWYELYGTSRNFVVTTCLLGAFYSDRAFWGSLYWGRLNSSRGVRTSERFWELVVWLRRRPRGLPWLDWFAPVSTAPSSRSTRRIMRGQDSALLSAVTLWVRWLWIFDGDGLGS